jgi:hypothetical protein
MCRTGRNGADLESMECGKTEEKRIKGVGLK